MRILVIEDEKRIAEAIRRSLETVGYIIDTKANFNEGFHSALNPDYDLIVLDRMLPNHTDGLEIVKLIRERKISTPVLLLSALSEVDERVEGLRAGADDYLPKPFSIKELTARIKVLLRRPKTHLGNQLSVGDLRLDSESREAVRAGRRIKLSRREYKLLNYLLHNQDRIISKAEIISHAWDADSIILPNTVEVYIGYLRKKIDKDFPDRPALIHTVFGFGYRIGEETSTTVKVID
jgi:DNA-binding response OmpR family regulator